MGCIQVNCFCADPHDVVIVVLSQKEGYHSAHADVLRKDIVEQANILDKVCVTYDLYLY